jgi:hypothetical protein
MKTMTFTKVLAIVVVFGALTPYSLLCATPGYMAFLTNGPSGTTVTIGDASSYMRTGTDWDKSASHIVNGVAVPTLLQEPSSITTWRDTSGLHFKFVVHDNTMNQTGGSTTTLACGDQFIVQIGPANSPDTQLLTGKEFRFEIVIQDTKITPQPIGSTTTTGPVGKRLPISATGGWNAIAEPSTTANATLSVINNSYNLILDIPFSEINNPTGDIGLAVAILNDLGHQNGQGLNDATGTAFPLGIGLTPESDPGLTCGAQPSGVTASGNWTIPSTWGTGYFNASTVAGNVTLSQSPQYYFSDSLRIGKCDVKNFSDIPAVSQADWISVQQANGTPWYEYNPQGPCRMGIWVNPNVTGTSVVKRRFLVVWGRPGISPQDWYFAGLTEPVALAPPSTPISFIWNNVPAVAFTDHPCMRVYVLPEVISASDIQTYINPLINPTGNLQDQPALDAMEAHFGVANGSSLSAQMNFSNLKTGVCTNQNCQQLTGRLKDPGIGNWPRYSPALALATSFAGNFAQVNSRGTETHGGDKNSNLVRIFAHAFAVSDPKGNRRYVYVEPLGGLGWAVPANLFGNVSMPLNMDVTLPKVAAKMFVGGKAIEIPSSPARVHFAVVTDALPGTPLPTIDTGALNKISDKIMNPGDTVKAQIGLTPALFGGICSKGGKSAMFVFLLGTVFLGVKLYSPRRRKRNQRTQGGK